MKAIPLFFYQRMRQAVCVVLALTMAASTYAQCTPPPSGLAGWWQGAGNANDFTGTNNAVLSLSGASYATGKVGQGFRFDGTNGYVQIPDSNSLKPAAVTVEAWVWLDPAINTITNSRNEQIVFKKNTWSAFFEGYSLLKESLPNGDGTYTDRFQFCVSRTGNQQIIRSLTIAQRGVWYHVAATYDGNQSKLFVNGVAEVSGTPGFALDYDTTPVFIGTSGTWAPYLSMFAGIIDEPTIYGRALSTNEIAAIYSAGLAGKCTSPNVTASNGVPVITSFAPLSGTNGALVTILGTNFSSIASSNLVRFGAVRANVLSASANVLTVLVPSGATLAPLTVTANGLTAYSGKNFQPTFFGNGSNTTVASFPASFNLPGAENTACAVISDFDGDGKPDIAFMNGATHNVSIYRNLSTNGASLSPSAFAARLDFPLPALAAASGGYRLRAVDLDGDGRPDLIACEINGDRLSVFHNLAAPGSLTTNSFATPFTLNTGNDSRNVAAADLDADGRVDIVAVNLGDNSLSIFKNIGAPGILNSNSFAAPFTLASSGSPYEMVIADLDGDGRPDLAVVESSGNALSLFQNLGTPGSLNTNSFAAHLDFPAGTEVETIVAVDLDGDGKLDLAVGSVKDNRVNIFRSTHSGGLFTTNSFAAYVSFSTPGWMHTVAVADFNGDAKPDLGVVGELGSYMAVFQNTATPGSITVNSFAPRVDFGTGWNPWGIATGDLDGDGRPDMVFCNQYDNNIQICQNQSPFGSNAVSNPPPACTASPSGLAAWWRAEGDANDAVSGNHATQTNGLQFTGGEAGQGFYFNGSSQIKIPASASLNVGTSGGLTFEAWIRPGQFTVLVPQFLCEWNDGAGGNGAHLAISVDHGVGGDGLGNVYFNLVDTNGTVHGIFTPSNALLTNALQHVAVTYDRASGQAAIYVNGLALASTNLGSFKPQTSYDFYLGNRPSGFFSGSYFNGQMDEPSLYNRALTTNEIIAIYNAGSLGKCPDSVIPVVTPITLLNVDFGAGTNTTKIGFAAAGSTTNDFWNFYTRDDGVGGWRTLGSVVNLKNADSSVTAAGLTVNNAPGAWGSSSTDPMYAGYIYPFDGGNVTVTITNLPAGTYDLLPYSPNGNFTLAVGANSYAVRTCYDVTPVSPPVWTEGLQYVRFTNVLVNAGQPLVLTVHPGVGDGALISGLQLALSSLTNALPAPPVAPTITQQPTNAVVLINGLVSFSVTAQGSAPLAYQWRFNGTNLAGATSATLTLSNISVAQAGNYSVLVANAGGSVTSSNAVLDVLSPSIIFSQTPSQVVLLGSAATFMVSAGGSAPLNYFWKRNNVLIPGATNFSYTLFNAQLADSGSKFSCLVTNAYGFAASTNASLKVINTISNDLCSGAVVITNYHYTNVQSTVKASSYGDPVPDCVDAFGNGVWYQFVSPVSGLLDVDSFGSDFDTGLAIYIGGCGAFTQVACNDDTYDITSELTIPTTAGTTYYFLVGGYGGHVGNLVFHLNYFTPPAFDVQPTNISVIVSSNAQFAAAVSGTQPISQQWYFNNAPLADGGRISGVTNLTLNIAGVITNDGGNYFVVASNWVGVTTSSVAVLTPVILPPVFILQPVAQSILTGSNVNFFAVVDGTPPYSYQWYQEASILVDDGHFNGANTPSLTISNLTTADAHYYSLVIANASGSVTSAPVLLTVLVPPSISLQPIGRSVPPGLPTTITASAAGIPAPTYQWQLNGTNVPGATSGIRLLSAVSTNDLGFYHLVCSNAAGVAVSAEAQLTFGPVAVWGRNAGNESLPPPGLSNVIGLAGNSGGSFALLTDGTVVAWGAGVATNVPANATNAVAVFASGNTAAAVLRANGSVIGWNLTGMPGLSNIVSLAVSNNSGTALRAEGTLVGWGLAPYTGFPTNLNHLTAVSIGTPHGLALRDDGTVVAWGAGPGTNLPAGLANVSAVAAGSGFSLALQTNGKVVTWGTGVVFTNLPNGTTNIIAISVNNYSAGGSLCLALRADGVVLAWGASNFSEQVPPPALRNLFSSAIAAGTFHGLALVNDGLPQIIQPPVGLTAFSGRDVTLRGAAAGARPLNYQWLFNGTNILGATNSILNLPNIQAASAGGYQLFVSNALGTAISLAAPVTVISNSTLNFLTQTTVSATNVYQGGTVKFTSGTILGSGPLRYQWFSTPTNNLPYAAVASATNDTLLLDPALASQSGFYYLAVSNLVGGITSAPVNVRVQFAKAWGYQVPTNVPLVTNAIAIATGGTTGIAPGQYFAIGADGKLTGWSNSISSLTMSPMSFPTLSNSLITAVAASYLHQLVLKSDGTVSVFGSGATNVPNNLSGVTAIACGTYHDLALKADGTITGWISAAGATQNNYGQATNVPSATNIVAMAAGNLHSLALRADGSLVSWGYGADGTANLPGGATNIVAITAGSGFSAALRADGLVFQWGNGITSYPIPSNVSNVVAIAGSANHCTALKKDGTVVTWGNEYVSLASNNIPADLTNVIAIASGGDHDLALFGTRAPAFTVQPWNRSVATNASFKINLVGKCAGAPPVNYQWLLNGTNLPGATNDLCILTNQLPGGPGVTRLIQPGTYQLIASNSYGVAISKPAKVSVFYPLAESLDTVDVRGVSPYNWLATSAAPWFGQTAITHDGMDAARSGGIGGSEETILQTTLVTNFPGGVTFWWKVSSEQFFDTLEFRVNGTVQASLSGEADWTFASIPVAAGTNLLQWRYSKDFSFDTGLDAAFVDQFSFVVGAPVITNQPASLVANLGANITLSVAAVGAPTLRYQWRQNGTPLGGNSPVLTLNSVSRAQNGTYSVTVTNSGGMAVSSNALVRVNVPQLLGTPVLLPDGSLQFTATDANGGLAPADISNFEAQATTDLVNWTTLPNALTLTNGTLQLNDATRTNFTTRFYRILEH